MAALEQWQDHVNPQHPPSPPNSTSFSSPIPNSHSVSGSQHSSHLSGSTALTPPTSPSPPIQPLDLEIVIAHYNETLDWLHPFTTSCHIYSKGQLPSPSSAKYASLTQLPNIGRETHTYLTHITQHYDTLPAHLLLLQGDIHTINHGTPAHTSLPLSDIITQTTHLPPLSVLPIGLIKDFSDWNALVYKQGWIERRGATLKRSAHSPGEFWKLLFNDPDNSDPSSQHDTVPESVRFVQGACFGVTREAIQRRPRAFYERALKYFEDLNEMNPEEGHYMERFWYCVLDDGAIIGEKNKEK